MSQLPRSRSGTVLARGLACWQSDVYLRLGFLFGSCMYNAVCDFVYSVLRRTGKDAFNNNNK